MPRTMIKLICSSCAEPFKRVLACVKYQRRHGAENEFCSQRCTGLGRRTYKPKAVKVREKAAYDASYRATNSARLKRTRAAYFQRTYDPEKARRERAQKMAAHVVYCRKYYADPKRKADKVAYDLDRRAAAYGDYAEAYKLLLQLQDEIRRRIPDRYERAKARGYYDRVIRPNAQQRRRDAQISRW
jgi:hypothetical protein